MSFRETLNWYQRLLFSEAREKRELKEINSHISKELIKRLTEENNQLKNEIKELKQLYDSTR